MAKKDKSIEVVRKDVDENGISLENHMQLFARLIAAGPTMHGTPSPRRKRG